MRKCGIDVSTVHLGGPPVDNVAIDEEGERTMVRLAVLACLLGLGLSWWSLRSITLTLIVFACGILSAAAGLAAVWLSGTTADAVVLSMPTLIYILAISGAVHLINYYRDAIDEVGVQDAPQRAIAHGWKPALLCSVTTAFGLLSLCTSDLTPVRKFGMFSALAMMLMLIVLFVFLPAALQRFPLRAVSPRAEPAEDDLERHVPAGSGDFLGPFWQLGHSTSCQGLHHRLPDHWLRWLGCDACSHIGGFDEVLPGSSQDSGGLRVAGSKYRPPGSHGGRALLRP